MKSRLTREENVEKNRKNQQKNRKTKKVKKFRLFLENFEKSNPEFRDEIFTAVAKKIK